MTSEAGTRQSRAFDFLCFTNFPCVLYLLLLILYDVLLVSSHSHCCLAIPLLSQWCINDGLLTPSVFESFKQVPVAERGNNSVHPETSLFLLRCLLFGSLIDGGCWFCLTSMKLTTSLGCETDFFFMAKVPHGKWVLTDANDQSILLMFTMFHSSFMLGLHATVDNVLIATRRDYSGTWVAQLWCGLLGAL